VSLAAGKPKEAGGEADDALPSHFARVGALFSVFCFGAKGARAVIAGLF